MFYRLVFFEQCSRTWWNYNKILSSITWVIPRCCFRGYMFLHILQTLFEDCVELNKTFDNYKHHHPPNHPWTFQLSHSAETFFDEGLHLPDTLEFYSLLKSYFSMRCFQSSHTCKQPLLRGFIYSTHLTAILLFVDVSNFNHLIYLEWSESSSENWIHMRWRTMQLYLIHTYLSSR